ncbi:hypothetical protein ACWIUE_11930, partial [Helicobacter sp. 23-1045]
MRKRGGGATSRATSNTLDSSQSSLQNSLESNIAFSSQGFKKAETIDKKDLDCHKKSSDFSRNDGRSVDCYESLRDSRNYKFFTPKFYFILGIIFNLSLLCFFKYTDFLLENFNLFSQIAHLDFEIPLPHILLPLALSFVTFQQIAFLFDCYKHATGQSNE